MVRRMLSPAPLTRLVLAHNVDQDMTQLISHSRGVSSTQSAARLLPWPHAAIGLIIGKYDVIHKTGNT